MPVFKVSAEVSCTCNFYVTASDADSAERIADMLVGPIADTLESEAKDALGTDGEEEEFYAGHTIDYCEEDEAATA